MQRWCDVAATRRDAPETTSTGREGRSWGITPAALMAGPLSFNPCGKVGERKVRTLRLAGENANPIISAAHRPNPKITAKQWLEQARQCNRRVWGDVSKRITCAATSLEQDMDAQTVVTVSAVAATGKLGCCNGALCSLHHCASTSWSCADDAALTNARAGAPGVPRSPMGQAASAARGRERSRGFVTTREILARSRRRKPVDSDG
jgi:hypothetical protein